MTSNLRQDVFCVALLAVACMLVWIPALGIVTLNPDESEYEATASYRLVQLRPLRREAGRHGPGDLAWIWLPIGGAAVLLCLGRRRSG